MVYVSLRMKVHENITFLKEDGHGATDKPEKRLTAETRTVVSTEQYVWYAKVAASLMLQST